MDGIGATEMLHIFIAAREDEIRPGATGRPVPGYEAKVIDAEGNEVPPGTIGRLAVRGPTGCRYLADERQRAYVERGWNVTGDTYIRDEDGYFWYQARSDDMIVSAGYNIAGPEVEAALLTHPAVAECGVVGAPDPERGMVVKAYVVLRPDVEPSPETARALQEHVKAEVAPYKYPRVVEFVSELPKTETGKLQRFELRRRAQGGGHGEPRIGGQDGRGVTRREPAAASALPRAAWRTTILVRFAHCDPAGIVYYARFFDMMNGAIEDWFSQSLGLDYHAFIGPRRIGLGYAKADADFFAPATMGDRLTFAVLVDRIGGASSPSTSTPIAATDADPVRPPRDRDDLARSSTAPSRCRTTFARRSNLPGGLPMTAPRPNPFPFADGGPTVLQPQTGPRRRATATA